MKHHAWAKQLIVLVAFALATAPAGKTAKSPFGSRLDGKTGSIERVSAPPVPSDHNSGAQEAAPRTPPPSPEVAAQPTVKPPQVTYQDGELTIIAENSSLSEVMKALRACLGADIDLPTNVTDQHIWVRLGPGPARRVLRDLLDSTEFNYVIQASDSDPNGIRSVLLTPRSKSTGPETAGPQERSAMRKMPGPAGSEAASGTESENPSSEPVASADAAPAASSAAGAASPTAPTGSSAAGDASPVAPVNASSVSLQYTPGNSASAAMSPPPPTDPNEMIQTLQSLYEQRRQLQKQQNQRPAAQNQ